MLVVSFTLCQLGQRSLLSVFWAIPPIFLGGSAAAAGIALINSLGNLGGFVGPTVVGSLRGSSGNYTSPGPARARCGAGHRGDPGRVDAVAATCLGRPNRHTCLNRSDSVIAAATAIPMTTARLIQTIACVRLAGASGPAAATT